MTLNLDLKVNIAAVKNLFKCENFLNEIVALSNKPKLRQK